MCWYQTRGLYVGQDLFRGCSSLGGSETTSKLEKETELVKSLEGTKHCSARGHKHPSQPQLQWRGSPAVPRGLGHQPKGLSQSRERGMGSCSPWAHSHRPVTWEGKRVLVALLSLAGGAAHVPAVEPHLTRGVFTAVHPREGQVK